MPDSIAVLPPGWRATDSDDQPISGAKLKFYEAGTNTAKTVYSDSGLATSLGSTVTCDASGYPASGGGSKVIIYTGTDAYDIQLTDADDVQEWRYPNVKGAAPIPTADTVATPENPVVYKTSAYTVLTTDRGKLIKCDPTSGTFAVTLLSAVTAGDGFVIGIRHSGDATPNVVTIRSTGGQYISKPGHETCFSFSLIAEGETAWLVSDGTQWTVMSMSPAYMHGQTPFFVVEDRLTAAPASPVGGQRYIVNGTTTGTWSTLGFAEDQVVESDGNGSWLAHNPGDGWIAYVKDENVLTQYRDGTWTDLTNITAPAASTLKHALFLDQRADGTVGGLATAGAWTTATIQTQKTNTITGCSLAANAITLPAGTYSVTAAKFISAGNGQGIRLKLANGGSPLYYEGINNPLSGTEKVTLQAFGAFTLAASDTLTLEYYVQNNSDTGDLGEALSISGNLETYAAILIEEKTAAQGPQGTQGPQGADGLDAAHPFQWNTATTGDPGTGKVRIDNASFYSSATQLGISETSSDGAPLGALFATWDDSTSSVKGTIKITREGTTSTYAVFRITGAGTDQGTYWTFPITWVSSNGAFTDGMNLSVLFIEKGDKGDAGTTVPDPSGLTVLPRTDVAAADKVLVYDASAASLKVMYPLGLAYYDPRDPTYGATGDGSTDDRAALFAADAAAAAAGGVLEIAPGTYRVNSNLTLTARLRFAGGVLRPASGITITINEAIDAPEKQIFDVSLGGTIAGNGPIARNYVLAAWWGAVGDGSTDNASAIGAALNFCDQRNRAGLYGGKVWLGLGKFVLNSGLSADASGVGIEGIDPWATEIIVNGSFRAIDVNGAVAGTGASYGFTLRNLSMSGNGTTSEAMIYFDKCNSLEVSNCYFLAPYIGIHAFGCEGTNHVIDQCYFTSPGSLTAGSTWIYLQGDTGSGTTGLCERFHITRCGGVGVNIDYGVRITGADSIFFSDCLFSGPATAVLDIDADQNRPIYNIHSTGCTWEGLNNYADYGVRIKGSVAGTTGRCDAIQFVGGQMLNGTTAMVRVEGTRPTGIAFTGVNFKQGDSTVLQLHRGQNISVLGCTFQDADGLAAGSKSYIEIGDGTNGPTDVQIIGNKIHEVDGTATVPYGIRLRTGTGIRVLGNTIRDVTTAIYSEVASSDFTCAENDIGVRRHTVASAGTLVIPLGCDRAYITGTTTIASIDNSAASGNSSFDGREVTLVFASTPLISHGGGNMLFAQQQNYRGATNSRVVMRYDADDSAWHEVSRYPTFGTSMLTDGITAPAAVSGLAQIYVDTADGDLKVIFGDGTVKTIVVDT